MDVTAAATETPREIYPWDAPHPRLPSIYLQTSFTINADMNVGALMPAHVQRDADAEVGAALRRSVSLVAKRRSWTIELFGDNQGWGARAWWHDGAPSEQVKVLPRFADPIGALIAIEGLLEARR